MQVQTIYKVTLVQYSQEIWNIDYFSGIGDNCDDRGGCQRAPVVLQSVEGKSDGLGSRGTVSQILEMK